MTYLGAGNERHGKIFNYSGFDINVNLPAGHFWLFDFDDRAIANGGQLVLPKDGIMYWRGATNTQFDGYIIQGGGLRLAPVADLTELSILAASEYNQVLVKSNLSEYVFKPTADLSAPENADASNLVDNAGTGKWVVKNAGLISVPDFLVNEINNTPITIPNYAPIEQITFVWKDRRDGIGNNVGDARRLTEVWSPVNLTGALTVHPGWTQSGGAVTSTFTKTISLNSQPYEFTVFITHTVAGFRILVHDQHAATVNTYGGWEAIVEYEQTYSVNGLAISNGSGAAGQTLQSNGDGTATWV